MAGATPRGAGTTTALLTCMLLLAGALEAGATLVGLAGAERASVAATGSMPTSLLGVTLATILASAGGRVARLAALFGASLALLLRVGLMLVLVLDGGAGAPQLLSLIHI